MGIALSPGGRQRPGLIWSHFNQPGHPLGKTLRLPGAYLSYVGLSAMDALGTFLILALGGVEVNPVANAVLTHLGFPGMVLYKFIIVTLVILMCERIVREKPHAARRVMALAIGVTCIPVLVVIVETICYFNLPG
ncbi:MAG: DUF5658 family protein [Planctomycetota bacterium]